jgi:hypothetical protein
MLETDFGWALAKMRDGYAVRRQGVNPMFDLRMVDADSKIVTRGGETITGFSLPDVLAYDWELAE